MIPNVDLNQVESLLKLAKKHKLKSLTVNGVSFIFRDPTSRSRAVTQGEITNTGEQMPSDEDMLFYSSDSAIQVPKSN